MEPTKYFNNIIIGQFVLTGVPVKVYIGGRYLTITDADDVEDPIFGFGMDEDGDMQRFDYRNVMQLSVAGNVVDLETYNKGMEAKFSGGDDKAEEPKDDEKEDDKEKDEPKGASDVMDHRMPSIADLIKEISQDEVDAEIEAAESEIDAAKAKEKAAKAAVKDKIKTAKDKIKAAKAQMKVASEGVLKEDHQGYTFGVGDIVKNKNTSCPHHGSMGVVKKLMKLANDMGTVAIYTVMNSGPTYKPGDSLAKTIDQLEPIQKPDGVE